MFEADNSTLHWYYEGEHLQVQPWGPDSLRIRSTRLPQMPSTDWALSEPVALTQTVVNVPHAQETLLAPDTDLHGSQKSYSSASVTNGLMTASVSAYGKLKIINNSTGKCVLEEYNRTKIDHRDPKTSALEVKSREFRSHGSGGSEYHISYRMESQSSNEKIYGMGQYQQPFLNLKGIDLELAQRNSQASVPFYVSSLGYGFLWNNPAVGRVVFGRNSTTFEAYSSNVLDFWIVVGSSPKELLMRYADVVGHAPMIPDYALGFWQSKLRYKNQEELLETAREYKRRNLPIDVIVADYFHWPLQGDWDWDRSVWPDAEGMVQELNDMNIRLVVSVWPTVDKRCKRYSEMTEKGYLIKVDRGLHTTRDFMGQNLQVDFTNPAARRYIWEQIKKNYHDKGIVSFWLDEAEPEYNAYDFENYRYYLGPARSVANIYPRCYSQAFFEGQQSVGQQTGGPDGIVNLVRCAWAGSQKFGALVWSGDIASSWTALRSQLAAGLNMGLAGIPWWTTDIGGFYGADSKDQDFRELLVRWFQWGTFCPVMRLHGCREPQYIPEESEGGLARCASGAENEVWSFGDDNYEILVKFLKLRQRLRPYIKRLMQEASDYGSPVMRTMFFEFPEDETCWEMETQYMFGDKYLCAPILQPGQRDRQVYLPKGNRWSRLLIRNDEDTTEGMFVGGSTISVHAPIDDIPIFLKLD